MCEIKNSKEVKLSDRVRFRCKRCGECCRHVAQTVDIEPVDANNMSKYSISGRNTGISIAGTEYSRRCIYEIRI